MKNRLKYLLVMFGSILLMLPLKLEAQTKEDFIREQFISEVDTLNYRILFPKDFTESKNYPVVLVLHGAGERGDDNESQLVHGSDIFLNEENREKYPGDRNISSGPETRLLG